MTIETEAGYTWTDGKHARLLHDGNRFAVKFVTPSAEATAWPASLLRNELTRDRWKPFENQLDDPQDFSAATWTTTGLTVASDGKTLTETATDGEHGVSQSYTFTASETVVGFKVTRQTGREVQIRVSDGTTTFSCFFDLRDGAVGTASNCTGQIFDIGDDQFLVSIYFTPVAATGTVELLLSVGAEIVSYVGNTSITIQVNNAYTHLSSANVAYEMFDVENGTCFAIAAHNLGSSSSRVTFEYDAATDLYIVGSTDDYVVFDLGTGLLISEDSLSYTIDVPAALLASEDDNSATLTTEIWTSIGSITPEDDSPIMFFMDAVSSSGYRITIDRGVMPEIGVLWVGDPLKMERPFYAGFTPSVMNRGTEVIGNISRTGELLGRSVKRTILQEQYQWNNLTYSWVRANLDGKSGVIQSLEAKPAFLAWRPSETEDVSYIMKSNVTAPSASGTRDLWSFSFNAEVYSYE